MQRVNCEMYSLMFESVARRDDRIYCASFCYYLLDENKDRTYIDNHYGERLIVNVDVDNTKLHLSFAEALLDIASMEKDLEEAMEGKFIHNDETGTFYVDLDCDYFPTSFCNSQFYGKTAFYSNDGYNRTL